MQRARSGRRLTTSASGGGGQRYAARATPSVALATTVATLVNGHVGTKVGIMSLSRKMQVLLLRFQFNNEQ